MHLLKLNFICPILGVHFTLHFWDSPFFYAFLLNKPLNPVITPLTPFTNKITQSTGPSGKKIENLKNENAKKVCKPFKTTIEIYSDFE